MVRICFTFWSMRPPAPPPARVEPGTAESQGRPGQGGKGAAAVKSETLFGGASELQIEHRGSLYRLRLTSLGKLILTK
jgi:hypothetical protein